MTKPNTNTFTPEPLEGDITPSVKYTAFSPESVPTNTRVDTEDGTVGEVTLDPRAAARDEQANWVPSHTPSESASQQGGDNAIEAVARQVIPGIVDPLDTLMRITPAEGETYEALRQSVVNIIVKSDVLRTGLEVLAGAHLDAKNARDHFVHTPHLLREEPYMNEVWYRAGKFNPVARGIVEDITAEEGVITEVTYTPMHEGAPLGEAVKGSFSDMKDKNVSLSVASGYNNVFRGAEQEYQNIFTQITEHIQSIVPMKLAEGDPKAKVQIHDSTLTSEKAKLWGLRDSDFQGENAEMLSKVSVDTKTAYDGDDKGVKSLMDTVGASRKAWEEEKNTPPAESSETKDESSEEAPSFAVPGGGAVFSAPVTPLGSFGGGAATVPSMSPTGASASKLSPELQELLDKLEVTDETEEEKDNETEHEIPEGATPIRNSKGEVIGYIPAEEKAETAQTAKYGYYDPATGEFMPQDTPGAYDSERQRWVTVEEQREEFEREEQRRKAAEQEAALASATASPTSSASPVVSEAPVTETTPVTPPETPAPANTSAQEKLVEFATEDDELPELR